MPGGHGLGESLRRIWRGHVGWMLPLGVLVVSIVGLGVIVRERSASDPDVAPVVGEVAGTSVVAAGPAALVVQVDDVGAAVGFTVFALSGDDGGTVVFVPASTMVEIPGFGLDPISEAFSVGGAELASLTLRNLLAVEFAHVSVLDARRLSAAIRGVGDLDIDNPTVLEVVTGAGRIETLWPAGPVTLAPGEAAQFLEITGTDETELDRLVRHQAFWKGLLDARANVAEVGDEASLDLPAFLDVASLRAEGLAYRILPVETLGGAEELFGVNREELVPLRELLAPGSTTGDVGRARVQLLNGVGTPGLAEPVTELVLAAGVTVELTGNALQFGYETTQIVYYRDDQIEAALRIRDELGLGEVVKQRDPIDVVDVTIVIGADLAELVGLG